MKAIKLLPEAEGCRSHSTLQEDSPKLFFKKAFRLKKVTLRVHKLCKVRTSCMSPLSKTGYLSDKFNTPLLAGVVGFPGFGVCRLRFQVPAINKLIQVARKIREKLIPKSRRVQTQEAHSPKFGWTEKSIFSMVAISLPDGVQHRNWVLC